MNDDPDALPHAAPRPDTAAQPRVPPGPDPGELDSADLLQGRQTVAIRHNGSIYRLQATRLGKLILTK